jgi:flagellar hook-associated protein 2
MPDITIQGLASGLPPDLVDKLVALEQEPLTRLADQKITQQTRLQAVQELNAKLLSLKAAMEGLDARADFRVRTATSSDTGFVSVTPTGEAPVGTYTITDVVLAENDQKRHTAGVASRTDPLAPGTFAFTYGGGTEQQVSISGGETLEDLVSKINDLNAGVGATIINDGTSDYMVLSGEDTGAASTIQITANTTIAGFEAPDFTDTSTEQDASFSLDGLTITGTDNDFTTSVTGLTIHLESPTTPSDQVTVTVARDTETLKARITTFVDQYNSLANLLQTHTAYDTETGSHTILFGDATVRSLQYQMRSMLSTPVSGVSGSYTTLAELGITTNAKGGTLEIDQTKLDAAMDADFNGVGQLFYNDPDAGITGYAAQLADYLTQVTDSATGLMQGKTNSIEARIKALDQQIASTQRRVDIASQRIRDQFVNLEKLIADLNSKSNGALQTLQNLANTPILGSTTSSSG